MVIKVYKEMEYRFSYALYRKGKFLSFFFIVQRMMGGNKSLKENGIPLFLCFIDEKDSLLNFLTILNYFKSGQYCGRQKGGHSRLIS